MVSISTIIETTGMIWVVIFSILAVMYIYFIIRIKYMNSKGIDVYANMTAPYKEWDDAEEAYRKEDTAS